MRVLLFVVMVAMVMPLAGCCGGSSGIEEDVISDPSSRGISLSESKLAAQEPRSSEWLDEIVKKASMQAVDELGEELSVKPEEIWATAIDCRDLRDPRLGTYQGDQLVYPASVVKLCYMVATYDQLDSQLLNFNDALYNDLEQMIQVSSNKATARILDRLCNTGFGPELEGEARESFEYKRHTVYRYMQQLGLDGLYAVNKTYDDDIPLYGREWEFLGEPKGDNYERSNMMTTDDTARLLYLIWQREVVSPFACGRMLDLMKRDEHPTAFSAILPEEWTLYSKSGLAGVCRHDAGIFERPDGGAIIVVVFTKQRSDKVPQSSIIKRTGELILNELSGDGELDNATAVEEKMGEQ